MPPPVTPEPPSRLDRAARWASSPQNATFALAWAGIVFMVVFWVFTERFEPAFVATFGGLLTASGLLSSRQQAEPPPDPRPLPAEPTDPSLSGGDP